MTRETAWLILNKYLKNPVLIKHSLATEATMRSLAPRFQGDMEEWGITGLLHDGDYEKAKGHPEDHGILLFKLESNSIPTVIEHAIEAHNWEYTHIAPESPMDWALYCCDELTGIITAAAQKQSPDKTKQMLSTLTPEGVLELLKKEDFAKGTNRQKIILCEEKLGIPLQEFIEITLTAMQGIHEQLGL